MHPFPEFRKSQAEYESASLAVLSQCDMNWTRNGARAQSSMIALIAGSCLFPHSGEKESEFIHPSIGARRSWENEEGGGGEAHFSMKRAAQEIFDMKAISHLPRARSLLVAAAQALQMMPFL